MDFTPENAPFKFTSYLTIYANPAVPMVFEQDFYISSLIKTKSMSPNDLPENIRQRGDMFYIEKPANNTGWAILIGAGIMAGAVVLESKTSDDYVY